MPDTAGATHEVCGAHLRLLPERAAFWEETDTLLVADPHWGKAATFRAAGIAVPSGTTTENLDRLNAALGRTGAQRLIFLGDLFHARQGKNHATLTALAAWREQHPALETVLVRGNHDRHAGDPPPELRIRCVDAPLHESPFILAHHPEPSPLGYVLAGHLHPAITLRGQGRLRVRLPCFHFAVDVGVLPAFGSFTGLADVRPLPDDYVWAIADGEVLRV